TWSQYPVNLILFGFKASGKTYFGKKLANQLNCPFIDTDEELLGKFHSCSISQLYKTLGKKNFRHEEEKMIFSLHTQKQSVIALGGGGAILNKNIVPFLQTLGDLIYLKTSFETVKERILKQDPLPAF